LELISGHFRFPNFLHLCTTFFSKCVLPFFSPTCSFFLFRSKRGSGTYRMVSRLTAPLFSRCRFSQAGLCGRSSQTHRLPASLPQARFCFFFFSCLFFFQISFFPLLIFPTLGLPVFVLIEQLVAFRFSFLFLTPSRKPFCCSSPRPPLRFYFAKARTCV